MTSSNGLYKDISVMLSGTLSAQLILIGITPILTRLYIADDFGNLSVFMSTLLILGVGTTGKYEMAIVIPKSNREGSKLVQGILFINHFFAFLILMIFLVFYENIITFFNLKQLSYYLFLVPVCILVNAYNTVFNHWVLRHRKYYISSSVIFVSAVLISFFNLIFGYTQWLTNGLILAYFLAQAVIVVLYFYFLKKENLYKPLLTFYSFEGIKSTLGNYVNFPKYQLPSEVLFTTAAQVTPIIFAYFYTQAVVGYFAIAIRLVKVPLGIIANAIDNVFKNESLDMFRKQGNCIELFLSLLKKLFMVAVVPFTILFFIAPELFAFILGEPWRIAGNYAQLLVLGLFFELMSLPFKSIFQITNTQFIYLRIQGISVILILLAIFVGYYMYNDPWYSVLFFSVAVAITHVLNLSYIYLLAKGNYAKINWENSINND